MSPSQAAVTTSIRTLLRPVLQPGGFDLEDVTVTLAGRRRLVRVIVDRDGGLTLDHVAEVSTSIAEVLDGSEVLGENPYVLEVSSPGVDRPLREPRHWRRAVGRLVTVKLPGIGMTTARIAAADDAGVVLSPPDAGEVESGRRWDYSALGPGSVQVEFGRPVSEDPDLLDKSVTEAGFSGAGGSDGGRPR